MLKYVCVGLLSIGLVAPSQATSLTQLLKVKHPPKVLKSQKCCNDADVDDFSGRWVGTYQGEQLELIIKQTTNSIEINGDVYEFNGLNTQSLASFDNASFEHSVFEKQSDGSIAFNTINLEKIYFEKGLREEKVNGQLALHGDKLSLTFEMDDEAPVVIEFNKLID